MSAAVPAQSTRVADASALDQLCIDTIRTLSMDAVQAAGSGHPGLPMAMAPVVHVLFTRFMNYHPAAPDWPDRDRFVLSAGHGSMLLYSILHLAGYDLPLEQLRRFRQWGSLTPGHPERGRTPGVETTTGPLGQGFANGVGMALAECVLRHRFGAAVIDHRVFGICSDGDLMEGVSAEAASLAGHLGLGRIVYIYDDNRITIDGDTSLAFDTEDVEARFRAYGWHTTTVDDANDLAQLEAAVGSAVAETSRPSLVRVRSVIGYPSPGKQGTAAAHGAPLGDDEVRATKEALGWAPDSRFVVPDAVHEAFAPVRARGERAYRDWHGRLELWRSDNPTLAEEWTRAWRGEPEPGLAAALPSFDPAAKAAISTRAAGATAMAALAPFVPTMVGGSADLVESTKTELPGRGSFSRDRPGSNVHWGVREHAMGAAVNGLAQHGGIVKPFGSTFLVFSDYMRPSIRLSALMNLSVVWVFTHDSVAVGEDGPTHQPVEQLAALRAIPGLTVIRPADANETVAAWQVALQFRDGPVCLLLTRQNVPVLGPELVRDGVQKGGYVLREPSTEMLDVVIAASGSEVSVALEASALLNGEGVGARVVSMPSWELFDAQDDRYRASVLPRELPTVSVEAGIAQGWRGFAHTAVSVERFGASAPGAEVLRRLGITAEAVAAAAREAIERHRSPAAAAYSRL